MTISLVQCTQYPIDQSTSTFSYRMWGIYESIRRRKTSKYYEGQGELVKGLFNFLSEIRRRDRSDPSLGLILRRAVLLAICAGFFHAPRLPVQYLRPSWSAYCLRPIDPSPETDGILALSSVSAWKRRTAVSGCPIACHSTSRFCPLRWGSPRTATNRPPAPHRAALADADDCAAITVNFVADVSPTRSAVAAPRRDMKSADVWILVVPGGCKWSSGCKF
ncbi:hypothetical protein EDB87DRAFT_1821193 [Lactarius vividus]|nr:hypothetical protein EDB87DRAFT_1821193 [Lactarius vividus]